VFSYSGAEDAYRDIWWANFAFSLPPKIGREREKVGGGDGRGEEK
jgi:hypothetical protein